METRTLLYCLPRPAKNKGRNKNKFFFTNYVLANRIWVVRRVSSARFFVPMIYEFTSPKFILLCFISLRTADKIWKIWRGDIRRGSNVCEAKLGIQTDKLPIVSS